MSDFMIRFLIYQLFDKPRRNDILVQSVRLVRTERNARRQGNCL